MAGKTTSAPTKKPRKPAVKKVTPKVAELVPAPSVARSTKPVFQAGTWLAVLLFAALIGFAVYLNSQKEKTAAAEVTPAAELSPVFNAENGKILSIEVKTTNDSLDTVKVARNAENVWVVEMPIAAEADQGLAEAAAAQVSALQVVNPIDADPEIFGLKDPAYLITIEFENGKHTLEVGDPTPTNSGYYVRVDNDKMMITDLSGIQSLLQFGFFPPYLNTPVPTPLPPTLTPVPPTAEVSTPVP